MSRIVDRGAIFAGWVGVAMAVVGVISLALVIPVQLLLFLFAPIAGALIGWYANARSERMRPWRRVFANALYAGLLTALTLALFYAGIRLLFVFADNGSPDFNRLDEHGQVIAPTCEIGPGCTYARYVKAGQGEELRGLGVVDGDSFGRYAVREQANGSVVLIALTLTGSLAGAAYYGVVGARPSRTEAAATSPS